VWTNFGGGGSDTGSLANPGYEILSNGLIIEWGLSALNSGGMETINFPYTFPNALLSFNGSVTNTGASNGGGVTPYIYFQSASTSSINVRAQQYGGAGWGNRTVQMLYWIATGY